MSQIIDFKEIPAGNTGGGGQDQFELFCRDFLEAIGFEIIQHPSRGADGGKDIIVNGSVNGKEKINWLVSCKHNAHSKTHQAVSASDEVNILERCNANGCEGFIGIYSTIASFSLSDMLYRLKERNILHSEIFDHRRIETFILIDPQRRNLFWQYFSESYQKNKHNIYQSQINKAMGTTENKSSYLTEEDFLRINITAIILIEIVKIKENYFASEWDERLDKLNELYKYSEYTNFKIATSVFEFLTLATHQTRGGMTSGVSIAIFSLTLDFFPISEIDLEKQQMIDLGKQCINLSFNMIYDSTIHFKDFTIAMYGLTILKFIYQKGKHNKLPELVEKVNSVYGRIEAEFKRSDRDDLQDALDLIKVFKEDIEDGSLSFPPLPSHLMKVVYSKHN